MKPERAIKLRRMGEVLVILGGLLIVLGGLVASISGTGRHPVIALAVGLALAVVGLGSARRRKTGRR